jgi:uncharacterized protein YbjT (DUF2867 family)
MSKLIAVVGATGAQGGSVCKFLLKDGKYKVRGLTRNPDKTKDLAAQGVEVVKADMNDVESLKEALKGCYGVFSVQNYWELFGGVAQGDPIKARDEEIKQGVNLADAAKAVGIKHFVHSTMEDGSNVPHFQSKAEIERYLKKIGVPTSNVLTSFYYENLLSPAFGMVSWRDDTLVFTMPYPADATLASYSVSDTGAFVLEALNNPDKWIGKTLVAISEHISMNEIVSTCNRVTGVKVVYEPKDMEEYRKGGPSAEELYLNLKWFYDHPDGKHTPREDVQASHKIYPNILTWESLLKTTGWKGPIKT